MSKPVVSKPTLRVGNVDRVLDARPDPLDFRDKMYEATLVYVPPERTLAVLSGLLIRKPPTILDQGSEGACTGFALAAVANYLLQTSKVRRPRARWTIRTRSVSARMLYEMAKRYDEWPGEEYSGSSARGAMKGWHKHGVCARDAWQYDPGKTGQRADHERAEEARQRPLGAYFRVNHQRPRRRCTPPSPRSASSTRPATVHAGWDGASTPDGMIPPAAADPSAATRSPSSRYDERGFWIQNSWGADWGITASHASPTTTGSERHRRLGRAPRRAGAALNDRASIADRCRPRAWPRRRAEQLHDLRPHIISIGNDGRAAHSGPFGTNAERRAADLREGLPARHRRAWRKKRASSSTPTAAWSARQSAIQRVADYRASLLEARSTRSPSSGRRTTGRTLTNILQRRAPAAPARGHPRHREGLPARPRWTIRSSRWRARSPASRCGTR